MRSFKTSDRLVLLNLSLDELEKNDNKDCLINLTEKQQTNSIRMLNSIIENDLKAHSSVDKKQKNIER